MRKKNSEKDRGPLWQVVSKEYYRQHLPVHGPYYIQCATHVVQKARSTTASLSKKKKVQIKAKKQVE